LKKLSSARAKREKQAAAFREMAAGMQRQIAAKRDPAIAHQNITARRARIATSMSADADYLEQLQIVMVGMAEDIEVRRLPRALKGITTKAMIEQMMLSRYHRPGLHISSVRDMLVATRGKREVAAGRRSIVRLRQKQKPECFLELPSRASLEAMISLVRAAEGYPGIYLNGILPSLNTSLKLLKAGITNEERWKVAHEAIRSYLKDIPDRSREKELRDLEYSLIGAKIPGFFPTPAPLINQMLVLAEIEPGMTILEPSAGKGDIAEVIRRENPGNQLVVIEWSLTLVKILRLKGFDVIEEDFLKHEGKYDRIIMNPPFEKLEDIDHVQHAYSCIKPGGRVVSIMSEAPFFRSDKKAQEFRTWLAGTGGASFQLGQAFQGAESFRQTGVNSRVVVLEKI
jgi:phospholipid N-methyltransferase